MGSIYIGIVFVFVCLTILLVACIRQRKMNILIPAFIYAVLFLIYLSKAYADIQEYKSYNQEDFSDVTGISIDKRMIRKDQCRKLFESLKDDEFSWVNHPVKRKEYLISIFTHRKVYKFKVWDTYNQGVLISRINDKGKEFVTNRNDYIIQYLE